MNFEPVDEIKDEESMSGYTWPPNMSKIANVSTGSQVWSYTATQDCYVLGQTLVYSAGGGGITVTIDGVQVYSAFYNSAVADLSKPTYTVHLKKGQTVTYRKDGNLNWTNDCGAYGYLLS